MLSLNFSFRNLDPHIKKPLFFINLVLLAVTAAVVLPIILRGPVPTARLKDNNFNIEVRRTAPEQKQGLSGREKLNGEDGMLFLFETSGKYCMWMKDMKFSIDILWFDEGQRLVHQERGVSPETFPHQFCSAGDAKYVLEVPAGTAARLQLQQSDEIVFSNL